MMQLNHLILFIFMVTQQSLFNFNKDAEINDWIIVNDTVMGGVSTSFFNLDAEGNGAFYGRISLENNGGFCSVRYQFDALSVAPESKITLKLKGDGKNYQFRIKFRTSDYYSYVYNFKTNGDWEEIIIPLNSMYPTFRGNRLDKKNFNQDQIEEIAILIGNKKSEDFKLLLDEISISE